MNTVLIGAGYWGSNFIRLIENKNNSFELKYVVDSNVKIEKYETIKNLENFEDKLNDITVAFVCTPTLTHYEIVKFLLSRNINVFVEKPLTTNESQAEELYSLAEEKDLQLFVDHTFLYNDVIKRMIDLIKKKEIGDLLHISFERTNLGPIRTDVSCLWDLATHDVSILNSIVDEQPKILSGSGYSRENHLNHDMVNISVNYSTVFASIFASWLHPEKIRKIKVVGTEKMLVFDDLNPNQPLKIYNKKIKDVTEKNPLYGSIFNFSMGDIYSPYIETREPLMEAVLDFEKRILKHKGVNKLNSKKLTLKTINFLEEVSTSIEK